MRKQAARRRVTRIEVGDDGGVVRRAVREDHLAAEEPLEIRLGGRSFVVTMRTPGHDVELAQGFLVGEGVIRGRDDLLSARYCAGEVDGENTYNVLDLQLAAHVPPPLATAERHTYTTSSCGVCGKASIDAVRTISAFDVASDPLEIRPQQLVELPQRLRDSQPVFERTGGLHGAALFDGRSGELLAAREDVGRHNAVDKVVGWAVEHDKLPLAGTILMLSGRAGFELIQKASMAGIPCVAAVSAPSSLAAELAQEAGITLVGFLRDRSMVAYSGAHRLVGEVTRG
ncbi:FdhD protein [Branchiibius hedensis]|uniref:Sulfur carrier protein FdhD n=1 Tax=Branchiibius hedensis TaxID=672460 RepID=A0A2Y8ZQI4_9MICO|nr:formate dehydrogenase accessory sulfurtransferase FdhD [Branchiibius hedensis]PWJ25828.1 FdhD protein [Branchiibius hedensis]SSA34641.1 FdhD protein [Branchiibius hedensis]